jgi:hypothetical protein
MRLTEPDPAAVAETTNAARASRSPADRAVVADPERARRRIAEALVQGGDAADSVMRRGFERAYDAFTRRDWELNTILFDRERFVFQAADLRDTLPDARERYDGVGGYVEAMNLFLESWSDLRVELVDLVAVDRPRAVSLVRFTGVGRLSGIPFDQLTLMAFEFEDGLVVSQSYWWDARRGATALGLELPTIRS